MNYMHETERAYAEAERFTMGMDKVIDAINKVNRNVKVGKVPEVSVMQLHKMMNPVKQIINGSMQIVLEMPIVMEDLFHRLFVVPLPTAHSNKIPLMKPHSIIVNQRQMLFLNEPIVTKINDTLKNQ